MNPELPIMAPKNEIPGISAEYPIPHLQERQKQPDTPLLGWIGFGSMGWAMSGRLLDAGMNLTGYNRDSTKVPVNKRLKVAKTPGDVSRDARILFMMLTDGHATHSVLSGETGILSRLSPGTIVVNMSTISPKEAEKEAQIVEDAGGIYLDIPVSGSVVPAQNGQLLLLAGGPEKELAELAPILSILGKETLHLGDVGAGMTGKLIINTLLAAQMESLAQTVSLGEDLGFSRERILDLVFKSPLSCAFYQLKKENLTKRDHPKAFSVALMEKDLALAQKECLERSISSTFATELRGPFQKALEQGFGDQDLSAVFEVFRGRNPS